ARGGLDLAFVMLPVADGPFDWQHLWTGEYVVMTAADSPLADGRPSLEDVARLPLIGYRNIRRALRLEEHLRAMGLNPQVVFRTDDNGTLQRLVGVGMGAALVPTLAVEPNDPAVRVLHAFDGLPPFLVGIAWHAERTLEAPEQAFVETARDVCRTFTGAPTGVSPASARAVRR
ncbi:MAG TPA: LysR family transcriptional regulator substrate-binding protein, partial [Conexibacter sp.]|nr:LysR family transcriptional regulator substrate-binding protein [Conexibacter sp.]